MIDEIIGLINKHAYAPVFITTGYALLVYRQLGRELKIFCAFLFLSGLVELISKILWFQSKNNMPLLHFYVAVGFACLAWFYSEVLKEFIDQKIIWGMCAFATAFVILNLIFFQDAYTFASWSLIVESILVIILSLLTFIMLMNDIVKQKRMHLMKSLNWINSGLFIYYASSLLIFYFGDLFTRKFPVYLNQYTWTLHALFMTIMYFCFLMGLRYRPRVKEISL